jgi:hypothetical protein
MHLLLAGNSCNNAHTKRRKCRYGRRASQQARRQIFAIVANITLELHECWLSQCHATQAPAAHGHIVLSPFVRHVSNIVCALSTGTVSHRYHLLVVSQGMYQQRHLDRPARASLIVSYSPLATTVIATTQRTALDTIDPLQCSRGVGIESLEE